MFDQLRDALGLGNNNNQPEQISVTRTREAVYRSQGELYDSEIDGVQRVPVFHAKIKSCTFKGKPHWRFVDLADLKKHYPRIPAGDVEALLQTVSGLYDGVVEIDDGEGLLSDAGEVRVLANGTTRMVTQQECDETLSKDTPVEYYDVLNHTSSYVATEQGYFYNETKTYEHADDLPEQATNVIASKTEKSNYLKAAFILGLVASGAVATLATSNAMPSFDADDLLPSTGLDLVSNQHAQCALFAASSTLAKGEMRAYEAFALCEAVQAFASVRGADAEVIVGTSGVKIEQGPSAVSIQKTDGDLLVTSTYTATVINNDIALYHKNINGTVSTSNPFHTDYTTSQQSVAKVAYDGEEFAYVCFQSKGEVAGSGANVNVKVYQGNVTDPTNIVWNNLFVTEYTTASSSACRMIADSSSVTVSWGDGVTNTGRFATYSNQNWTSTPSLIVSPTNTVGGISDLEYSGSNLIMCYTNAFINPSMVVTEAYTKGTSTQVFSTTIQDTASSNLAECSVIPVASSVISHNTCYQEDSIPREVFCVSIKTDGSRFTPPGATDSRVEMTPSNDFFNEYQYGIKGIDVDGRTGLYTWRGTKVGNGQGSGLAQWVYTSDKTGINLIGGYVDVVPSDEVNSVVAVIPVKHPETTKYAEVLYEREDQALGVNKVFYRNVTGSETTDYVYVPTVALIDELTPTTVGADQVPTVYYASNTGGVREAIDTLFWHRDESNQSTIYSFDGSKCDVTANTPAGGSVTPSANTLTVVGSSDAQTAAQVYVAPLEGKTEDCVVDMTYAGTTTRMKGVWDGVNTNPQATGTFPAFPTCLVGVDNCVVNFNLQDKSVYKDAEQIGNLGLTASAGGLSVVATPGTVSSQGSIRVTPSVPGTFPVFRTITDSNGGFVTHQSNVTIYESINVFNPIILPDAVPEDTASIAMVTSGGIKTSFTSAALSSPCEVVGTFSTDTVGRYKETADGAAAIIHRTNAAGNLQVSVTGECQNVDNVWKDRQFVPNSNACGSVTISITYKSLGMQRSGQDVVSVTCVNDPVVARTPIASGQSLTGAPIIHAIDSEFSDVEQSPSAWDVRIDSITKGGVATADCPMSVRASNTTDPVYQLFSQGLAAACIGVVSTAVSAYDQVSGSRAVVIFQDTIVNGLSGVLPTGTFTHFSGATVRVPGFSVNSPATVNYALQPETSAPSGTTINLAGQSANTAASLSGSGSATQVNLDTVNGLDIQTPAGACSQTETRYRASANDGFGIPPSDTVVTLRCVNTEYTVRKGDLVTIPGVYARTTVSNSDATQTVTGVGVSENGLFTISASNELKIDTGKVSALGRQVLTVSNADNDVQSQQITVDVDSPVTLTPEAPAAGTNSSSSNVIESAGTFSKQYTINGRDGADVVLSYQGGDGVGTITLGSGVSRKNGLRLMQATTNSTPVAYDTTAFTGRVPNGIFTVQYNPKEYNPPIQYHYLGDVDVSISIGSDGVTQRDNFSIKVVRPTGPQAAIPPVLKESATNIPGFDLYDGDEQCQRLPEDAAYAAYREDQDALVPEIVGDTSGGAYIKSTGTTHEVCVKGFNLLGGDLGDHQLALQYRNPVDNTASSNFLVNFRVTGNVLLIFMMRNVDAQLDLFQFVFWTVLFYGTSLLAAGAANRKLNERRMHYYGDVEAGDLELLSKILLAEEFHNGDRLTTIVDGREHVGGPLLSFLGTSETTVPAHFQKNNDHAPQPSGVFDRLRYAPGIFKQCSEAEAKLSWAEKLYNVISVFPFLGIPRYFWTPRDRGMRQSIVTAFGMTIQGLLDNGIQNYLGKEIKVVHKGVPFNLPILKWLQRIPFLGIYARRLNRTIVFTIVDTRNFLKQPVQDLPALREAVLEDVKVEVQGIIEGKRDDLEKDRNRANEAKLAARKEQGRVRGERKKLQDERRKGEGVIRKASRTFLGDSDSSYGQDDGGYYDEASATSGGSWKRAPATVDASSSGWGLSLFGGGSANDPVADMESGRRRGKSSRR